MFKDRIKELRADNDLSLVQFAATVGISKTTVSLYESGKQNPGKKTIAKICDAFDVTEEWLLGEDETTAGDKTDVEDLTEAVEEVEEAETEESESAEDAEEPEAVDDAEEPEAEDDAEEPEAEDDAEEPEAEDDAEEPEAEDDAEEPEAEDDAEEPEAEDDAEEPEAEDDAEEPEAVDDAEEPEAADDTEEPEAVDDTEDAEAAHIATASEEEEKYPAKKPTDSNTKGESKMSKKTTNKPVPPIPFTPFAKPMGKTKENDDARKEKVDEVKEKYKDLLKKYRQENINARKTSTQDRKDKQAQAFDRFMEMQDTFANFLSENPLVLPFIPMYSIFPKKMMKQFMEIERLSNEFFKKQADNYADFCEQRKNMFLEMMASAVTKNEEPEEKSEEPEEKDEAEEKD